MTNRVNPTLLAGAFLLSFAFGQASANEAGFVSEPIASRGNQSPERPLFPQPRASSRERSNPAGGFIEFVFGERPGRGDRYRAQGAYQQQPSYPPQRVMVLPWEGQQTGSPQYGQPYLSEPVRPAFDPKYEKQIIEYHGKESPGTIVIDTANKFLYLVQANGTAMRYGIGVGRPGFTWSGIKQISAKREWPDWTPPAEMLARRPDLPRHMEGGPENPLGARAMYLGSSLYRIHGSNEPWTIGTNVSSGCIRMRNEDVIDLYDRVNVGTRVVVI
jgi:lipoprotein-anchoring transpeptidase ErfK/SrfK